MANSLRAKLSKLRHDGHITEIEYQAFIKKMDGRDDEIRNKAIDEFVKRLYKIGENREFDWEDIYRLADQLKGGAE